MAGFVLVTEEDLTEIIDGADTSKKYQRNKSSTQLND